MITKLLTILHLWLPSNVIQGTVYDEFNNTMPGVHISMSDGNHLYTDLDGTFEYIAFQDKPFLIKAEFVSYKTDFYMLETHKDTSITITLLPR